MSCRIAQAAHRVWKTAKHHALGYGLRRLKLNICQRWRALASARKPFAGARAPGKRRIDASNCQVALSNHRFI